MFWIFKKTYDVVLSQKHFYHDPMHTAVTGTPFVLKADLLAWTIELKDQPKKLIDHSSGAKILRFKNKNDAIICKMRFG